MVLLLTVLASCVGESGPSGHQSLQSPQQQGPQGPCYDCDMYNLLEDDQGGVAQHGTALANRQVRQVRPLCYFITCLRVLNTI